LDYIRIKINNLRIIASFKKSSKIHIFQTFNPFVVGSTPARPTKYSKETPLL